MKAFGLDLSDQSLKLIELKKEGPNIELANFCDLVLPEGAIVKGRIVKEDVLVASVKESILKAKKGRIKGRFVVACVPEFESFVRIIRLPNLPEEELSQAVKWEAEQHIPLSSSEVYLDWQKVGQDRNDLEILVAAAAKKLVDAYVNVLKKAGLIPLAIEVESAATVRGLIREEDDSCYLLVDLGRARTSLIIYDHKTLQFTSAVEPFGQSFSEKISKDLGIDFNKGESLKKTYGLARESKGVGSRIYHSLLPLVQDLSREIETAGQFYQDHFPRGQKINKIILCGGGAKLKGIVPELKIILKQEVVLGNPWVNILKLEHRYLPEITRKESLGYATAIGLALRGLEGI